MTYLSFGALNSESEDIADIARDLIYCLKPFRTKDGTQPELEQTLAQAEAALKSEDEAGLRAFVTESFPVVSEAFVPPWCFLEEAEAEDGPVYVIQPDLESLQEAARIQDGVLKLNAGDEWPEDAAQTYDYVMEVSDHGNVTLYSAIDNKEIWSCV